MQMAGAVLAVEPFSPPAPPPALPLDAAKLDHFRRWADVIACEIDEGGVACLDAVVTDEWLAQARSQIASRFSMRGVHELVAEKLAAGQDSFARGVVTDEGLHALMRAVAMAACPELSADGQAVEDVLRLVNGPAPAHKPLGFHYDRSVVTVVLPIHMPEGQPGEAGELILFANPRPYRRFAVTNVLEKLFKQNDVFRRGFVRRAFSKGDVTVVAMKPGNAYLFWGYRSFHATLPCPADTMRATLILHYGSVHQGSALLAKSKTVCRKLRAGSRRLMSPAQYVVINGAS
jgi:hypothetical protein